jgi:hypothetical protein
MELAVGDTVTYSLPLDGDKSGTLFTSVGRVSGLSLTHATLEVAEQCKFPYSSASLPVHHRAASHSSKVDTPKEFKLPRLFIRRVVSKKTLPDPKVIEGVHTDNGALGYTMWCAEKRDYVFQILTFDMRKLTSFANPHIICVPDYPIRESMDLGKMITARPLDAHDPAENMILKQNSKAVVVTMANSDYFVPLSVVSWGLADFKAYVAAEIKRDFTNFGCRSYQQIKAVRKSPEGYYAFTEDDSYIDLRAFLGTVYIDHQTGHLKVASHGEETRKIEGSTEFFRAPFFKEGYGVFLAHEVHVSKSKKMAGFYNMSLCLNNLMILLNHGLKHPLFNSSEERAVQIMDNPDCPGEYVQDLVHFYLHPLDEDARMKVLGASTCGGFRRPTFLPLLTRLVELRKN